MSNRLESVGLEEPCPDVVFSQIAILGLKVTLPASMPSENARLMADSSRLMVAFFAFLPCRCSMYFRMSVVLIDAALVVLAVVSIPLSVLLIAFGILLNIAVPKRGPSIVSDHVQRLITSRTPQLILYDIALGCHEAAGAEPWGILDPPGAFQSARQAWLLVDQDPRRVPAGCEVIPKDTAVVVDDSREAQGETYLRVHTVSDRAVVQWIFADEIVPLSVFERQRAARH